MSEHYRYCPQCAQPLARVELGGLPRSACPDPACGFVFWDNPTPVVAAIVEHEGDIILARNVIWPAGFFALITGFLERNEDPELGVVREVEEELNLRSGPPTLIGHYLFEQKNQLIIAYHVPAEGEIRLNEELAEYIRVAPDKARYWPAATGYALRDWLKTLGHDPQEIPIPSGVRPPN